jgi:hypothetical protein
MRRFLFSLIATMLAGAAIAAPAAADGTETLGPPTVTIANGTGVTVGGIGMFEQPSELSITVPDGATVEQVLLYWEAGHRHDDTSGDAGDETMQVNGIEVQADTHIGGPTFFYGSDTGDVLSLTHRVDITSLGLVGAGTTVLSVSGLDTDEVTDGAAVVVIYSEPGVEPFPIQLVDGNDIAFVDFEPPRDTTVPQTFTFEAAAVDRVATLSMAVSSLHDPVGGSQIRPNIMVTTVGGETNRVVDPFPDTQGLEMDTLDFSIPIPAGADELTVQMLSERVEGMPELPASLVWLVAALALAPEVPATTTTQGAGVLPDSEVSPTSAVLPFTGPSSSSGAALAAGAAGLAAGLALVWVARRRVARHG